MAETCGDFVYWWDGEFEGSCQLPKDHDGPHFDNFWWDADGEEVAEPTKEAQA